MGIAIDIDVGKIMLYDEVKELKQRIKELEEMISEVTSVLEKSDKTLYQHKDGVKAALDILNKEK